jgi:hypothetical protein
MSVMREGTWPYREQLSDFGVDFVDTFTYPTDRDNVSVDVEMFTDTNADRRCWRDGVGYPGPNLTNGGPDTNELGRTDAVQKPEGFGIQTGRVPSSEGIIHYGVVKVENNFLGLFLRNWAQPNKVNRFSRVILTPHEKSLGRINVNTVVAKPVEYGQPLPAAFNPLIGLPGIMGEFGEVSATGVFAFDPRPFADTAPVGPGDLNNQTLRALQLVYERGRMNYFNFELPIPVERFDGRYYLSPSELVVRGDNLPAGLPGAEVLPPVLFDPTVNTDAWSQFDEMKARFARMAAEITARSDVFQISVTAQAGYGRDANNDGIINWRDNNEFTITGERKTRTVYER